LHAAGYGASAEVDPGEGGRRRDVKGGSARGGGEVDVERRRAVAAVVEG
jgi:hypothetical protein